MDNQTFIARCWTDKAKLVEVLNQEITRMVATGEAPRKTIDRVAKQLQTSKSNAGRVVMTESAHFATESQKECYKELGADEYEVVETLDHITCPLCGEMDGKVFPVNKMQSGTTAPPFHPWCRGTTAPYYEDMVGVGQRFARDKDGKAYAVPSDMTYAEWKQKSVDNSAESGIISIDIDELVPCLKENSTGRIVDTDVEQITDFRKLSKCTEKYGWDFPWNHPPKDSKVFALRVKGSDEIEGLIALKNDDAAYATYMFWGNAAPHNRITKNNPMKKYNGVGGHLFAIAAQESIKNGFGGYIYADAANKELFKFFVNEFKAIPIPTRENPYRFLLEGNAIKNILDTYNFEWR
ncbi:MAG: minor capsid protein [Clostridia bacterium]|nr:minor capsid protein [Clostridia bacterium]